MWMKKENNFQTVKFSLRLLLTFCLISQPGVVYKTDAYKKKV